MLKGAIFDHDGLMFDTEKLWQKNWNEQAGNMGIILPEAFKHEICGTSGERMKTIVRKYYQVKEAQPVINQVVAGVNRDEISLLEEKPGLQEILGMFASNHVKMAVASSSNEDMLERNLTNDGIRDFFEAVVSGQHVQHGKPAPDIFLLAAEKLSLPPEDCYVFEDSFNGIRAAKAAGCTAVMIPDMSQPDEEMKQLADGIFTTLSEASKAIASGRL